MGAGENSLAAESLQEVFLILRTAGTADPDQGPVREMDAGKDLAEQHGRFKETVKPVPGLIFRWPKGETHDAYAQLGTFGFEGGNNNYLAWLQVEEVAHPLGKARTCESCHGSETQVSNVKWHYLDTQGAEPFDGSQKVVADHNGIHVKDIKATTTIKLMDGGKIENFAAWMKLGDIWKTSGDFSIPKSDPVKYRELDKSIRTVLAQLDDIAKRIRSKEANGEDAKKLRRRWKEARAAAVHDPGSAKQSIDLLRK